MFIKTSFLSLKKLEYRITYTFKIQHIVADRYSNFNLKKLKKYTFHSFNLSNISQASSLPLQVILCRS